MPYTHASLFSGIGGAESVKALGNAIGPQVIYEIFKAIEEYERGTT